jgi:hypothetical protein
MDGFYLFSIHFDSVKVYNVDMSPISALRVIFEGRILPKTHELPLLS